MVDISGYFKPKLTVLCPSKLPYGVEHVVEAFVALDFCVQMIFIAVKYFLVESSYIVPEFLRRRNEGSP
jgi:hypothetical protein